MKKHAFLITLTAFLCLLCAVLVACGEEHVHTYGEWIITTPATCVTKGIQTRACDCGHSETQYIAIDTTAHQAGTEWKTDGTHHWNDCTRTGCDARVNEAAHTPAVAWSSDATNHWQNCSTCGYDMIPTAHVYDAENTCACQHYKDADVKFTLNNGTYTVTDYTGTATEVIIPSKYKGIAVTAIGDYAFYDCTGLQSITIPEGVTSIGERAFLSCSGLTDVYITDLAAWCNIDFGNASANPLCNAENLYLNGQLVTDLEIPSSVTAIKNYAFCGCSGLQSITIPAGVTTIGDYAFYGCSSLQTITIPAGVTTIGASAFCYCGSLQSVTFGENSQLTAIGNYAFSGCSLQSITIPASVTSIGYGAFSGCSKLTSVTFGNPDGWWVASSSTATSGTELSATDLAKTDTAAGLMATYREYYWKRG